MFCEHNGLDVYPEVTRIEFEYMTIVKEAPWPWTSDKAFVCCEACGVGMLMWLADLGAGLPIHNACARQRDNERTESATPTNAVATSEGDADV